MKTALAIISVLVFISCSHKTTQRIVQNRALPGASHDCDDTSGTVIFYNKHTVEIRINVSNKTSTREGNVIVNSWKNFVVKPLPPGDSLTLKLRSEEQFMYAIYGPISTNVGGMGKVAEEKFTLKSCEVLKVPY